MLDLARHARPAPGRVDLVQQRARWIAQPRTAPLLGLQVISFEARPALQRIVMPAAAGEVFIAVEIAVRQDVEAGALFIADDDGEGVLEFFAEADVHHAGVERTRPHAHVEPARPRPRTGHRRRKHQVFCHCVRHTRSIPNPSSGIPNPESRIPNRLNPGIPEWNPPPRIPDPTPREPRTANREPRTANREPRTANRERCYQSFVFK